MEIDAVKMPQAPSVQPQPAAPKKDIYDLDIDIRDKVDQLVKENIPSRGCGTTNTCRTPCGTCIGCMPVP